MSSQLAIPLRSRGPDLLAVEFASNPPRAESVSVPVEDLPHDVRLFRVDLTTHSDHRRASQGVHARLVFDRNVTVAIGPAACVISRTGLTLKPPVRLLNDVVKINLLSNA